MDPTFYFPDAINRHAVVVKPKQPFRDWLDKVFPDDPVGEIGEANIYLVKEKDTNELVEKWLSRNFDMIFQNELNDWYLDEALWPEKRTWAIFKKWFEYEIHSLVLDLEDTQISKS